MARTKRLSSPVAGDADCLLMPNLDAANVSSNRPTTFAMLRWRRW
ncbi:MAG: hypothetical protein ACLR8Y_20635 [Alistipes indistinctus]